MTGRLSDEQWMQQTLALAREGVALTSPNPCVGAILVAANGEEVGRGTHTYEGKTHAEMLAIQQAGRRARGATLYVNLEPCSHFGRTGPCADAVIEAGIRRVFVAVRDPNPLVGGRGIARMQAAGIEVIEGIGEAEAKKLNEAFARYIRHKLPFVTLKTAMTLDGKIAPPPGESDSSGLGSLGSSGGWITSEVAREHVHQMRHANDAILVGVGTVIADDPLLTDRTGLPRRRPLLRVILDSRLRLSLESRVVKTAHEDVIVFCCFAEENKRRELESRGIIVEQVPMQRPPGDNTIVFPAGAPSIDGRPDLNRVMAELGKRQITSLIIEGGALVNWAALSEGIVDKIFFYYAPKILAGTGSIPFALGAGYRRISEAASVQSLTLHRFGEDFAVEGYLRDPYRDEIRLVPPLESGG
jgi:diaminohydroxyphosphoribosylaminopyrimidine deaminase / 5-amino-6-(5-phosphoribosylamino)uracil reductase